MPRASIVPQHFRTTQVSGPNVRALNNAAGTESTATLGRPSSSLGLQVGYLRPEQSAATDSIAPVGTARGYGWALTPSLPTPDDGLTIAAGTVALQFHVSRAGGLLTTDVTCRITAIIFVATTTPTYSEAGRATSSTFTVTTTEVARTLNISISTMVLPPGGYFYIEIYTETDNALTGDTPRFHTNSTSACRLTAIPDFTIQYARAWGDAPSASDAIVRQVDYARPLVDAPAAADALTRVASFPRAMTDSPAISDAVARLFTGARALADAATASDAIVRAFTGDRSLQDDAGISDAVTRHFDGVRVLADAPNVSDAITRQFAGARSLDDAPNLSDAVTRAFIGARDLADSAALADAVTRQFDGSRAIGDAGELGVTDDLSRQFTANRALGDVVVGASDDLSRVFGGARALNDAPSVTDSMTRAAVFARGLLDELSEAGGDAEYPTGLLRLRPDGRVEAVPGNTGPLPSGALRITTVP
jgi:hypothetical protein